MESYGAFAHRYDAMMHDVDYDAWVAYLESFLQERQAKTVLDCACGTGRIGIALCRHGYTVTGSDRSADMLFEARSNALKAGCRTMPFIQQDLTAIALHQPIDAIVCACDGVNYLTRLSEVRAFFMHAKDALSSGGLLLFDVSSPYKFSQVLGDRTFTEETDDYAYIWRNAYDPHNQLCEMLLTWFEREGDRYRRCFERHLQRAHTRTELLTLLSETGFSDAACYGAFTRTDPKPDDERLQFVAIKP